VRAALACALLVACTGDGASHQGPPEVVVPEVDSAPAHGLALWLTGIESDVARVLVIELEADAVRFEIGAAPTYRVMPAADSEAVVLRRTPFALAAGVPQAIPPRLVAWVPDVPTLDVHVRVLEGDAALVDTILHVDASSPLTLVDHGVTLTFTRRVDPAPWPAERLVGMHLEGTLAASALADRVGGTLALKVYAGTRRWLVRPDCDSDAQCASDGASRPCVTTCACRCDADACDCDFSGLESSMEAAALANARRITGTTAGTPEDAAALARVRLHWVFKRSLGGSSRCAENGELDVTPTTFARFFAAALHAAIAIDRRLGYPLIDIVSPMNEANHPLQDGAHVNAAGQSTLGGFLSFVDAIHQASCSGSDCCAADRYIVSMPDVPALLTAALQAGQRALDAAGPGVAPRIGLSLYLDTEQVDPLQGDPAPSIVTPVSPFMRSLGSIDGDLVLVVDTYPGSWGAPWYESDDRVVHHMDPELARVVRVDPVIAADDAVARALAAAADVTAATGREPADVILGEVGWSTFDGDEAAQESFVRRLFDAVAAEPRVGGLIWFKSRDRAAYEYPTWTSAANPLTGDPIACSLAPLGPIVCAADVLATMEGQWGLTRVDDSPKPAWRAFIDRWARYRPSLTSR